MPTAAAPVPGLSVGDSLYGFVLTGAGSPVMSMGPGVPIRALVDV